MGKTEGGYEVFDVEDTYLISLAGEGEEKVSKRVKIAQENLFRNKLIRAHIHIQCATRKTENGSTKKGK